MEYVEMLKGVKDDINIYLIVLLSITLVLNIIDWLFGWLNARFNSKIEFKSNEALYGIIKKMMYFIVLIVFTVVSLAIIPHEIAIPAITGLFLGYIASEVNSILSHLNATEDGKKHEVFSTFIKKILKGDNK